MSSGNAKNYRIKLFIIGLLVLPYAVLASGNSDVLTNENVIGLVRAEISDSIIIEMIESRNSSFSLSVDDILKLKESGVSDELIRAMISASSSGNKSAEDSSQSAAKEGVDEGPRLSRYFGQTQGLIGLVKSTVIPSKMTDGILVIHPIEGISYSPSKDKYKDQSWEWKWSEIRKIFLADNAFSSYFYFEDDEGTMVRFRIFMIGSQDSDIIIKDLTDSFRTAKANGAIEMEEIELFYAAPGK